LVWSHLVSLHFLAEVLQLLLYHLPQVEGQEGIIHAPFKNCYYYTCCYDYIVVVLSLWHMHFLFCLVHLYKSWSNRTSSFKSPFGMHEYIASGCYISLQERIRTGH